MIVFLFSLSQEQKQLCPDRALSMHGMREIEKDDATLERSISPNLSSPFLPTTLRSGS